MSSWTLAGNLLTVARESASHVSFFVSPAHAYIGIQQWCVKSWQEHAGLSIHIGSQVPVRPIGMAA
jgi:hypothetical protein